MVNVALTNCSLEKDDVGSFKFTFKWDLLPSPLGFLRVTNGELFLCARTTCRQYLNSNLARPLQCEPWKLAAYQKCFLCAIGMSGISQYDTIELGNIYFFAVVQCSRHNLLCSGSNTIILNIRLQTMMVLFFSSSIGFEILESLSGSCCFHNNLIFGKFTVLLLFQWMADLLTLS